MRSVGREEDRINSGDFWFVIFLLGSKPLKEYVRTYSMLVSLSRFNFSIGHDVFSMFGFVGSFGFKMIDSDGGSLEN